MNEEDWEDEDDDLVPMTGPTGTDTDTNSVNKYYKSLLESDTLSDEEKQAIYEKLRNDEG